MTLDESVVIYLSVAATLLGLMLAVNDADNKRKETIAATMQEAIRQGADPIKVGCGLAIAGTPYREVLTECDKIMEAK